MCKSSFFTNLRYLKKVSKISNQLEKLEAARSAYLWLPLLWLPFLALLSLSRPY